MARDSIASPISSPLAPGQGGSLLAMVQILRLDQLFITFHKSHLALAVCWETMPADSAELVRRLRDAEQSTAAFASLLDLPGTQISRAHANKLVTAIQRAIRNEQEDGNPAEIDRILASLRQTLTLTLHEELDRIFVAMIDPRDSDYFVDPLHPLGDRVAEVYPRASVQVKEAGRCLGLGRYSATQFHLMIALEVVLRTLARSAGVNEQKIPDWGKLLRSLDAAVKKRQSAYSAKHPRRAMRAKYIAWAEARERLEGIKDARRNPTAHRPRLATEQEARLVYEATGAFIQKLAELHPKRRGSAKP